MKYLTDPDAFLHCQFAIDGLIRREKHLPEQVFKDPLSHFVFIHWDDIFHTEDFFEKIKSFLVSLGESRWFLAVIEPDPKDYFFRQFGKYSIIEMSVDDTAGSYRQLLQSDPGDSPADAIAFNSTVVVLYSDSGKWVIYGDRDYELAVVGFAEKQLLERFTSGYGQEWVFTASEAIEHILEAVYRSPGVPPDIREQFINNYSLEGGET